MRFLKLAVPALLLLAVAAAAAFGLAVWLGERKRARTIDVRVVPVAPARDAAALKAGKYLFESRGCGECHGMDGGGRVMLDTPDLLVRTPNLTRGRGTAVAEYGDADWVRAIRHGVSPRGRALLIMPSEDYNRMSDPDLAALVGYIRTLPPVDGEPAVTRFSAKMKALYGVGLMHDAASRIDHRLPPAPPIPVGATVEHGGYVANMCIGCHGPTFAGGKIPGTPPDWPPASNLTPGEGGVMGRYPTAAELAAMLRTGKRPDGTSVSRVMPFDSLGKLSDVDIQAMHMYLGTLPPRRMGER